MSSICVSYSINVGGQLLDLSTPCVMGILNITPDSFYTSISPDSSSLDDLIVAHVSRMVAEGAKMIDVGACSTRPGSEPVSAEAERERLTQALDIIHRSFPDCILSVDTFRSDIAEWCINEYGVQIINNKTDEVIYSKTINAENIVALNIDISAYEEGQYTITIENANEVFTGQFDTTATAIKEIQHTPHRGGDGGGLFNLQGQRIKTLQKGLNIVDGQKIYVK